MLQINPTANLFQVLSSAVLALFTVVLAIATWKYYVQSKSQTEEMVKSRKLNDEPQMRAGVTPYHGPNFCIAFVNIGGGIAQNVRADYWIEGVDDPKQEWGVQVCFPEDIYQVAFPYGKREINTGPADKIISDMGDRDDTLVICWEYQDASGETFSPTQRFSISSKLKQRIESGEFYSGGERDVRF